MISQPFFKFMSSTSYVIESRFVIRKRIRNRSSDAQDTGWRTEGAREKTSQAVRPLGLAVWEAVGPTVKGALCPRVGHAPPMARGWRGLTWLVDFGLLSPPISSLSLSILKNKKKSFSFPAKESSPIFRFSKHHIFLIRSRIWVIQVGECSYLSPLTSPSGLVAVRSWFLVVKHWFLNQLQNPR